MPTAPTISALEIADPPERWSELGFAVDGAGHCQLGAVSLLLGAPGDGIVGWALTARAPGGHTDIDGIATRYEAPATAPPGHHPNTATAVDHVVVATPDVDRTLAALAGVGMRLRREGRAGQRHGPALRQAFFRHGEAVIEVVGPADAAGDGPARLWGLTVTVRDLGACAAGLGVLAGPPHDAVQPGRRIATVRRQAALSTRLALISPSAP